MTTLTLVSTPPRGEGVIRLTTFGDASAERRTGDGEREVLLRIGKPLALLVYLSTLEGRGVTRERLSELFWGEESADRARASLRQALYFLRQQLEDTAIEAGREDVAVDTRALSSDREDFLSAVRNQELQRAAAVYAGPFCPRIELAGSVGFAHWVEGERERLRRLYRRAVIGAIAGELSAGRASDAVTTARAASALEPEDSDIALSLFDSLVEVGALGEARERLDAHRAGLEATGRIVPDGVVRRLDRSASHGVGRRTSPQRSLLSLGQLLVGRALPLSQVLQAADRAREGLPRRLIVSAPAGMGKSRLLEELEARLRLRGARVVRTRAVPAMRDIPLAALGDLLRGLCRLPGAIGVRESTAQVLVSLLPELHEVYPGAASANSGGSVGVAQVREAFADVLASVAESRLVAVLVDDLQYADEVSRAVLEGAWRSPSLRLLEVWATRPGRPAAFSGADEVLSLPPLQVDDARRMLEDVAPLAEGEWDPRLLSRLVECSHGEPQALQHLVRAACAGGHLVLGERGWRIPDHSRLHEWIGATVAEPPSMQSLASVERFALQLLVLWGRPIDERDLIEMMTRETSVARDLELRRALRHLEELGLIVSRETEWAVAHESVADASTADEVGRERGLRLLIGHWTRSPRLTVAIVEHLARLCGTDVSGSLAVKLAQEACRHPRIRASGLRGARLSRLIAVAAGHPAWETRLYRAMRPLARLEDRAVAGLGVVATVLAIAALWLVAMLQPRIVLEAEPLADQSGPPGVFEIVVQPRVALRNGFGRPVERSTAVVVRSTRGRLMGDTVVQMVRGSAQFEALALQVDSTATGPRPVEMTFSGPWYARDARVALRGAFEGVQAHEFRVLSATVNGAPASDLVASARLGDSVRIDLTFEYTTLFATANYLVGAAPIWGERERNSIRLAGLPSPVYRGRRSVTFTVPSPADAGRSHVVILFGLEENVEDMFSSTNWTVGEPRWHDGNDVADLEPGEFEALRRTGRLAVPGYLVQGYRGRQSEIRLGDAILSRRSQPEQRETREWQGASIRIDWSGSVLGQVQRSQ